jgi:hypothetical protein
MMKRLLLFGTVLLLLGVGCKKDQKETPAAGPSAKPAAAAGGKVEVPPEGKKFDPPVKKEQIPDGVWYCDMGTVEYARAQPGDGKCPLCGMRLKQKAPGKP